MKFSVDHSMTQDLLDRTARDRFNIVNIRCVKDVNFVKVSIFVAGKEYVIIQQAQGNTFDVKVGMNAVENTVLGI